MSDNKLILYPQNPLAKFEISKESINDLKVLGLIGEEFEYYSEKICFDQGKKFNDLIHFLENRKTIELGNKNGKVQEIDVVDNRSTCFIQLCDYGKTAIIASSYTETPGCRYCGFEIPDWTDILNEWYEDQNKYEWNCQQCKKTSRIFDLDWKRGLAFAQYTIEIWHIHYNEAIPSKELIRSLKAITKEDWNFLYFRL